MFIKYYKESGGTPLFKLKGIFKDSAVIKAIKLATPRILSILGEQLNVIVNTIISFTLTPGTLSAYKFAYSLHMVPVNIIGSAVAQVSLPDLAKASKNGDKEKFKKILNNALQFSMYLVLPIVAIIIILRLPIVRLTYGTGEFNWQDTLLTSMSLVLLSMSIIGQTIMQIVMRAFYALKDTWKPLMISIICIAVNLVSVYFLTNFFSHYYDWRIILEQIFYQISHANGSGVLPVIQSFFMDLWTWMTTRGESPLAIGMTYMVESIVGFIYLNKITSIKLITWKDTLKPMLTKFVNTLIMGIGMYFVFKIFDLQLDTSRTIWVALLTVATALYGLISYLLGSYLFKIKEFESIKNYVIKIFKELIIKLKRKNAKNS